MTPTLLIIAGVAAVGDWVAVWLRRARAEYLLKPATLALLVAAAATADLGDTKLWAVAALALGLSGDVALLGETSGDGEPGTWFLVGLAAFLLGHVAYLVAFVLVGTRGLDVLAGTLVVAGVAGLVLRPVLRGARRTGGRRLAVAVAGYAVVLSAMTVLATGTAAIAIAIGGVLFLGSDALLARGRFAGRVPNGDLLVIVSYHVAQFLLLIGLINAA